MVLVTGVAGFIGFHTAQALLSQGVAVVGVDNLNDYYDVNLKKARLAELEKSEGFTFHKADVSDVHAMQAFWADHGGFKRVIHLAAQAGVRYSLENPYAYINSNVMGQTVLLELCRHQEGFEHLVYASSSSVYGANTKLPFSVSDQVDHPVSLYAATKRSGELLTESYCRMYDLPATGLRFFTVYGPWGRPDMAPYIFTKAILSGDSLPVFNQGRMKRDFTYIDDIVQGVTSALEHVPQDDVRHKIYNLGNNKCVELMSFIREIEKATGKQAVLDMQEMQTGDVEATYADIDDTTQDLSYKPLMTIEEGVPRFVEWYRSYHDA